VDKVYALNQRLMPSSGQSVATRLQQDLKNKHLKITARLANDLKTMCGKITAMPQLTPRQCHGIVFLCHGIKPLTL
jgi:hypothetical protein